MRRLLLFLLLSSVIGCASVRPAATLKEGAHIIFLGDSITNAGAKPGGYVSQVSDSLAAAYPGMNINVTGAGISGNKVPDLLARLDRDVLSKRPTTVVVYIGINDVWHWANPKNKGTTPEDFESGLQTLIDRIEAADANVILCTPSVIGEKASGTNKQDAQLDQYSNISRRVAAKNKVQVCDLRQAFVDYLKQNNPQDEEKGVLTTDGVHLNPAGNTFVASRMLEALRNGKQ